MPEIINIYCDESCHLQNDGHRVMVLGAIWCPAAGARSTAGRVRDVKRAFGMAPTFEAKWSKVSPARADLYRALVDLFFDSEDLHFRALIVPDKSKLQHEAFGQTHEIWYYKMHFQLLRVLLLRQRWYHIYLDIKDTHSAARVRKLHEVLCNDLLDFDRQVVQRVQPVRSQEVEQLQLADLLMGAVAYANRGLSSSSAKVHLVQHVQTRCGHPLTVTTTITEDKVNIFRWEPQEV